MVSKTVAETAFQYIALVAVVIGGVAATSALVSRFRRKKAEEDVAQAKEDIEKAEEMAEEIVEEFRGRGIVNDSVPTYKGLEGQNFSGRDIWRASDRLGAVAEAAGRVDQDIWQKN